MDDPRDVRRDLVVRKSGAWSLSERGETERGCLSRGELREIETALAAASFEPPPPPEVTCMAMPTERIVYEDHKRGRRAAIERPCGKQALSPSVVQVSRLAGSLAQSSPSGDPPDAEAPSACEERGPRLVVASVGPIDRARGRSARAVSVTVATDGSWYRSEGGSATCGELSRRELRQLRRVVGEADLDGIDQEITCRAMPTTEHRLMTRGDRVIWQSPCGSASPTDDARELASRILELGA